MQSQIITLQLSDHRQVAAWFMLKANVLIHSGRHFEVVLGNERALPKAQNEGEREKWNKGK